MSAERKYYSHSFSSRTSDTKDAPTSKRKAKQKNNTLKELPDESVVVPEEVQEIFDRFLEKVAVKGKNGQPLIPLVDLRRVLIDKYEDSRFQVSRFKFWKYGTDDLQEPYLDLGFKKASVFYSLEDATKVLRKLHLSARLDFEEIQKVIEATPSSDVDTEETKAFEEPKGEAALARLKEVFEIVVPQTSPDKGEEDWKNERSITTIKLDTPEHFSSISLKHLYLDTLLQELHQKLNTKIFGRKTATTTIVDVGFVRYADAKTAGLFISLGEDETIKWGRVRTFFLFVEAVDKKQAKLRIEMMPDRGEQGKINHDPQREIFWGALNDLADYIVEQANGSGSTKTKYRVPVIKPDRFR